MYETETYGASNARMLTYYDLNNWYSKNMIENADVWTYSTFHKIYYEPYLKYQNLIDNHAFYWLGVADDSINMRLVDPSNRYVNGRNNDAFGARLLVSLPLESLVGSEDIGDRIVTPNGMTYSGGTYGTETT